MGEACLVGLPPGLELAGQSDVRGGGPLVLPGDGGLVDHVGDGAFNRQGTGSFVPAVAVWRDTDIRVQNFLVVT